MDVARLVCAVSLGLGLSLVSSPVHASPILWTDWTGTDTDLGVGFTGLGTINTSGGPITVTYTNPLGIQFFYTGAAGETDYWVQQPSFTRDPSNSPYTSATVDNIPTGTNMIALRYAGLQMLTFSSPVTDPVFSFISLNGGDGAALQDHAFLNQDFQILSVSDGASSACGYWGCGTAGKQVVDVGGGTIGYRLLSQGPGPFAGYEPHGTIQLLGTFSSLTWRTQNDEGWNGFTVGLADVS